MKKIISLVILCSILNSLMAQWTGTTHIYNTNSGNVGIGTASPGAKLEVVGKIQATGDEFRSLTGGIDSRFGSEAFATGQAALGTLSNHPFRFYTNSDHVMTLLGNGNVGINTSSPRSKLETIGIGRFSSSASGSSIILDGAGLPSDNGWSNVRMTAWGNGAQANLNTSFDNWGGIFSWGHGSSSGDVEVMRIDATSGNVSIGTTNSQGYKLAVNGDAIFTKVKVKQYSSWPDYVFGDGYPLMSLKELDDYIHTNKHLPDVPSAKEVEQNGLDLGDNQAVLLKKIEELTLYIIDLKKENEKMRERIDKLEAKKG